MDYDLCGSKLVEIVDTELLFDVGHFAHHRSETILAEMLLLVVLEFFAEAVVFMAGDELAEGGKEDSVFAGFMGAIHGVEGGEEGGQLQGFGRIEGWSFGKQQELVGDPTAGVVLAEQGVDQAGELPGLTEAGKKIVFFLPFVIIFYKAADDAGGCVQGREIGRLAADDLLTGMVIDQQDPVEQAVFLHQVFGRGDFFFFPIAAGAGG